MQTAINATSLPHTHTCRASSLRAVGLLLPRRGSIQEKMACGVHLGILLICLAQAEHVRCSWSKQAQSSQRQNSNAYVGFAQQQSGQGRLASNYPQNQLRLASAQSRSFNTELAASSGRRFSQVYSSGGDTNFHSQPTQSGHSSVRLVQSSSLSKPNWRPAKSNRANAQTSPKNSFGLSTAIASGSSVSKYKKPNDFANVSKKRTWPVQQGTAHVGKYVSSSSTAVQSPRSLSAAQKAPSAAAAPASYWPRSYVPVESSSRFSVGAPALQMQTSATARARRVSSHRGSKASKPSRFSPSNERSVNNPSQTEAGNRYKSKLFQPTGGNAQGSQSLPASQKQNALNVQPRSYTSTKLPASESSGTGASGQRFAPTRTYDIPDRFGGFAIRRLKEPADQKVSVREPQQSYPTSWQSASLKQQRQAHPAPPQQAYKPQVQSIHHESKWKRVRPSGKLSAAGVTG
ncbi:uncharacterized protein LOC119016874 [Acanthopagrus latus]|uniref:uncharacterized protein LOC119016874 n=1 Tax=Acanthopagrus latus TaxID=8177 RepID=UPI00187BE6C4|nr:uncharacterized protein LOC119016874 [Acanthopagrus latus]